MDRLSDYDYELPPELVAQEPLADRAASRLLWLKKGNGEVEHRSFGDLPHILRAGDLLVLNDTRVSALRLFGKRERGGRAELLLLREESEGVYQALAKPGRRLRSGERVLFENGLQATVIQALPDGRKRVAFLETPNLSKALPEIGRTPLPPYIHGAINDPERYQTVYAAKPGSSAAPTAGLHFTDELLFRIRKHGIEQAFVTLHVGLDTFRAVRSENLEEHKMHGEECELPNETAEAVRRCKGRIVAVGTTTLRTLESFATGSREVRSGKELTDLFIKPGFPFQVADGLVTNFHMPRTSMLVLLGAFAGRETVMNAYREAIRLQYRFLSFGDAMLVY